MSGTSWGEEPELWVRCGCPSVLGWAQRAGAGLRGAAGPGAAFGIPARGPGLLARLPLISGVRIKKGMKVRGLEVPRGDRAARLPDGTIFAPLLPASLFSHRAFPDAGTRIPRSSPALLGGTGIKEQPPLPSLTSVRATWWPLLLWALQHTKHQAGTGTLGVVGAR